MGENIHHVVDKSSWPAGSWHDEPDRVEWRHLGLPCLIVRNPGVGNLCGYVGLPPRHPWRDDSAAEHVAECHGGVTYMAACHGAICHVPELGEPDDVVWIGFDCAHWGDLSPANVGPLYDGWVYRDVEYVRAEVESLARQAVAAAQ